MSEIIDGTKKTTRAKNTQRHAHNNDKNKNNSPNMHATAWNTKPDFDWNWRELSKQKCK